MTSEWPKEWGDIGVTPSSDTRLIATNYVDAGAVRLYDDTLYINYDAGEEGENRDLWMPLDLYIADKVTGVINSNDG